MNKSAKQPSKIPIAITRVREGAVSGGAVGKLELTRRNNSKGNDKQLKRKAGRKEALTSRSSRTIKKVPNFKKLHKQFEAHVACGKVKKKPLTVFVEFPNKQNVSMSDRNRGHDKVYKQQDEMTITSIRSVAMGEKVKGEHHDKGFMLKFQELCKQYQTGYFQRPVAHVKHNTEKLVQLHSEADFKSLVEKAAYSQHRRCTVRHRPTVSPGYTRGMQEASEAMLRSVKRLYVPKHQNSQLDDVRANLANQLDCCSDRHANSRRNTMIL